MTTKPAPRRLATYSKGSRDHQGSRAPTPKPVKPATSDLYDFPPSDDDARQAVQRRKAATPAKSVVRQKPKAEAAYDFPGSDDELTAPTPRTKPATATRTKTPSKLPQQSSQRAILSAKKPPPPPQAPVQRSDDEIRKRNHTKAFETRVESSPKPTVVMSRRPMAPPSKSSASLPSSQSKVTPYNTTQQEIPVKPSPKQASTSTSASSTQLDRSPIPKSIPPPRAVKTEQTKQSFTPRPGKKIRLIDKLASQKEDSSGPDSGSDAEEERDASTSAGGTDHTPRPLSQAPSQTPMSQSSVRFGKETWSRSGTLVNKRVKLTYSQARIIREESQSESQSQPQSLGAMMDSMQDALVSSPSPGPAGDDFDMDEDEDDLPMNGIKSLHELRRAGANSRFGDEMEDLMSRIGRPGPTVSSMRRNALLDLAQKLQRNDFAAQFRDHPGRDNIAKDVGKESETISAFAIGAALTVFLSSHNAPHMLKRLLEESVGKLLARLLRQPEDIDVIARKRESNLSKVGRTSVAKIKTHLMGMPIWHGCKLTDLSPQTVGLRLLHILQRNLDSRSQSDMIRHLETELSDVAEEHAREESADDIGFVLVALIMEAESGADSVALGQDQITRQAATSAQLLRKGLQNWPTDLGEVPSSILKLAINTTNTDLGARAFDDRTILSELTRCITEGLRRVQEAVARGALSEGLYDGLLLNMGTLINVLEHCPASRSGMDDKSLDKLVKLYLDIRPSAMDVSTVLYSVP